MHAPGRGVPKGPWQHPLRPPGRAAPTPACCTTCSTRHRSSVPATGGWRLRAAVGAVICASRWSAASSGPEGTAGFIDVARFGRRQPLGLQHGVEMR